MSTKQEEASKAISLGLPYQTYLVWWHKTAVIGHHQQPKLLLTDHLYSVSNMHFPAFKTMQGKKENLDSSFIFLRYHSPLRER